MEQKFENKLLFLRCKYEKIIERFGPSHDSIAKVIIKISRKDFNNVLIFEGIGKKNKEAFRNAIKKSWHVILKIPDPCELTIPFTLIWEKCKKPICSFQKPDPLWFENSQILGIDWEGTPPSIVQICCKSGVYIDDVKSKTAQKILKDKKHKHCVFGKHEMHLVANPFNIQKNNKLSLAELTSIMFSPEIRLIKDKTIHKRVDWSDNNLSEEALNYAALDALVTRKIGKRMINNYKN